MSNLNRAMLILEAMADEPDGVRVTDLAEAMGVNRAIPYRIVDELCELGYVVQDRATERYRATLKLGSLGLRQLERTNIMNWAQEELGRLADETEELARVSIASGATLRFVAQAQGARGSLVVNSPLRAELALHATASGKAYLSTLPLAEVRKIVDQRGMPSLTDGTLTNIMDLEQELEKARSDGYAVVEQEAERGVSAVAAPIVPPDSADGRAVGAVSLAGPSVRLPATRLQTLGPRLNGTANRLAQDWHVFEYLRGSGAGQDDVSPAGASRSA